jgi:hypothetical protein
MILLVACAGAVFFNDYEIDWWTIDSGGGMFSTGGDFELGGTIGQLDASTTPMTGGDFELTGGFWQVFPEPDPCAGFLCGDCNCDGAFNGADIDPFFVALGDPALWQVTYPNCDLVCAADINYDKAVNGADIDPFFAALGAGSCP